MERMGHDSVRAAMLYQHPTTEASRRIADSIGGMIYAPRAPMATMSRRANGTLMAPTASDLMTTETMFCLVGAGGFEPPAPRL